MHARAGARLCMLIPALRLFLWHLRGSRGMSSRKSPYARNKPEAASDGVTSKRPADAGVSNRIAAMLFPIEFFFIAVTTFLSSVRCNRGPRRSKRARIK
jgi:hypothetical protein